MPDLTARDSDIYNESRASRHSVGWYYHGRVASLFIVRGRLCSSLMATKCAGLKQVPNNGTLMDPVSLTSMSPARCARGWSDDGR
jgi:hypothetical protein